MSPSWGHSRPPTASATLSHAVPHRPTPSHTVPYCPTLSHTVPHHPTPSHTVPGLEASSPPPWDAIMGSGQGGLSPGHEVRCLALWICTCRPAAALPVGTAAATLHSQAAGREGLGGTARGAGAPPLRAVTPGRWRCAGREGPGLCGSRVLATTGPRGGSRPPLLCTNHKDFLGRTSRSSCEHRPACNPVPNRPLHRAGDPAPAAAQSRPRAARGLGLHPDGSGRRK